MLIHAFNTLLLGRRLVVASTAMSVLLVSGLTLAQPRLYRATAAFVPQAHGDQEPSMLSGLLGAFGAGGETGSHTVYSLDFYAMMLQSRSLQEAVATTSYAVTEDNRVRTGELAVIFGLNSSSLGRAREEARRRLRGALSVAADPRTGIVRFSIRTQWPDLSYQLVQRALTTVDSIVAAARQESAAAELRFAKERIDVARESLETAEAQLQRFLARNRSFARLSALDLERARQEREIAMRRDTYVSLYQTWTRASLDAFRGTPMIVVIERPVLPAEPDGARVWTNLSFAVVLGLTLGIGVVFLLASQDLSRSLGGEPGSSPSGGP